MPQDLSRPDHVHHRREPRHRPRDRRCAPRATAPTSRCSPRPRSRIPSSRARSTPPPRRSRRPAAPRCRSSATSATPTRSQGAVEQAAERFGGIDILVNNASAISPDADRADRAQALRPDAGDQRARHVPRHPRLHPAPQAAPTTATSSSLSPPINLDPAWLGAARRLHALEVRHDAGHAVRRPRSCARPASPPTRCGRARSSRPPRSRTCSAATRRWAARARPRSTPTPPTRSCAKPAREYTGQSLIDDEVLAAAGVTDLEPYRAGRGRRRAHRRSVRRPRPAALNELSTVEAGAPGSGSSWTSIRSTHLTH